MTGTALVPASGPQIFRVRGLAVIFDADLAAALGLETRRLNEAVKRHSDLVDERHCFQLSREEFDRLRSQLATSSSGHGGRRHLPWAFTERGVTRVTTFINTPEALRASDLIVDTFITVQKQVAAGRTSITVERPSLYHPDRELAEQSRGLGRRLMTAINGLLDTVIDIRTGDTIADTAKDMTARTLENVRERLREKGLENLKLEAEIQLLLREAEKAAQEVEGKKLDNLEKRINLVQRLIALHREMEPVQLVELLDGFDRVEAAIKPKSRRLPAPRAADRGED